MAQNHGITTLADVRAFKTNWKIQVKIVHSWTQYMQFTGETTEMILADHAVNISVSEVIVLSSSIVRPKTINKSDHTKIHLTPYDLKLLHFAYPQRGLLFPKPDDETRIIHRLKTSLSIALEIYFPFAGRLVKVNNHEDNTVSFYIDCDSSGARFVHAKVESVSANDFLQPYDSVPDFKRCFFPANDLKSSDGVSEPLLALQVTEIKDGVFISFGYNHMVADGSSFWNFFHTWSKISRETGRPPRCEIPTKERVFHFTKTNISDLKAEANADITFTDMKISSLQAVLAHLWISIIKHSGLNREEDTHCIVAADMRRRLNPPLKKECFGNVTHQAIATAKVGEILDHGLGWAALQINKQANTYLIVTSSPWFEVYDNDFGWGKPIAVRAEPGNGIGISLVVFRGIEEGSIDVNATIPLSMWSDVLVNLLTDV
ncbi:Transferase [Arabidopsis suecica]|uniref:Transferase n=1 Tax=Arabidopsis suecica TaxID=45249 RepID=A0A8T1YQV6_ARASU|nr:Transferase [Arabidopsis suecica]